MLAPDGGAGVTAATLLRNLGRVLTEFGGPVARGERKTWAAAESLEDLCALTDRWLSGDLKSSPTYYGPVDVDEEDAPGLTEACRRLNRMGFLTDSSQAGSDGPGYDGRRWTQVAAVDGFAAPGLVALLTEGLSGTPYVVQAFEPRRFGCGSRVPVTWVDGRPCTRFGGGLSARGIRQLWGGDVGEGAVRDLCAALQVVIYDPEPGRNALWADLAAVSA